MTTRPVDAINHDAGEIEKAQDPNKDIGRLYRYSTSITDTQPRSTLKTKKVLIKPARRRCVFSPSWPRWSPGLTQFPPPSASQPPSPQPPWLLWPPTYASSVFRVMTLFLQPLSRTKIIGRQREMLYKYYTQTYRVREWERERQKGIETEESFSYYYLSPFLSLELVVLVSAQHG